VDNPYLNFAETQRVPSSFWTEGAYHLLQRIKPMVDPMNMILANHPIPPDR
jgi:hypothetical protein